MDLVKRSQPWLLPGQVRAVAAAPSRMCCPAWLLGSQPLHGQPLAGPRVPSTQEECNALAAPAPAVSSARVPHLTLLWREQKGRDWMVKSRGSGTAKCVPGTLLFSPPIIFTQKHSSLSLQRPSGSRSWSLPQPSGSLQGEQGARHHCISSHR